MAYYLPLTYLFPLSTTPYSSSSITPLTIRYHPFSLPSPQHRANRDRMDTNNGSSNGGRSTIDRGDRIVNSLPSAVLLEKNNSRRSSMVCHLLLSDMLCPFNTLSQPTLSPPPYPDTLSQSILPTHRFNPCTQSTLSTPT